MQRQAAQGELERWGGTAEGGIRNGRAKVQRVLEVGREDARSTHGRLVSHVELFWLSLF